MKFTYLVSHPDYEDMEIAALCDVLHCTPNRLLMYEVA